MSGSDEQRPSRRAWPRVQVHPGSGVVDRHGDTLLVVPVLPPAAHERVRELLELCRHRDPTGDSRVHALGALLALRSAAELPGFALLVRSGSSLRVLVHGPVRVLVDGRAPAQPVAGNAGRLAEHVLQNGAWHGMTVAAGEDPEPADVLPLDLESGTVPGAGVTLHPVPAGRARPAPVEPMETSLPAGLRTATTALRPALTFRTVPLGECAARAPGGQPARAARPPLPIAGARGEGASATPTTGPEVLVEGVHCP